ncbi:MAG: hypothetical protein ACYSUI_23845 [Planctomycetota bacterium]|jgi:hypothetical protein
MRTASTVVMFVAWCSVAGGCANPPDALKLSIAPQKEVLQPGEPIRFDLTFAASGGTLCLAPSRPSFLEIEMTPSNGGETMKSHGIGYCGTNWRMLVVPLLYPVLFSACLLDVGDCMGRFIVIPDGQDKTYCLELVPSGDGFVVLDVHGRENRHWANRDRPFPPGRYHVRAKFESQQPDVYPAPLFWTVYGQPAVAETAFVIDGAGTAVPQRK